MAAGQSGGPPLREQLRRRTTGSLDRDRGEVLVVGSSATHRLSRVFLGSGASKILRHSPVPTVVVP